MLMTLLLFDCLIVIATMVLDASYYSSKAKALEKHLDKCRSYGFGTEYCEPNGYVPKFGTQSLLDWKSHIHWASVAILGVFCIEVSLTVVAMGKYYFRWEN